MLLVTGIGYLGSLLGLDSYSNIWYEQSMAEKNGKFVKLKKKKVFEDIADHIREMVESRELSPGDQLPPERELAITLGVSRTSLREAIRALEMIGEVETKVGVNGGTFIREVSLDHAMNIVQSMFNRTNQVLTDIVEVRLILETKSAYYAAKRRTDEDLKDLFEVIDEMEKDIKNGGFGMKADHKYHLTVAKASENKFLFSLSQLLEDMIEQTRLNTLSEKGVPEEALEDHRKITEAIKNKNATLAEVFMRSHLMKAYNMSKKMQLQQEQK